MKYPKTPKIKFDDIDQVIFSDEFISLIQKKVDISHESVMTHYELFSGSRNEEDAEMLLHDFMEGGVVSILLRLWLDKTKEEETDGRVGVLRSKWRKKKTFNKSDINKLFSILK